MRGLNITRGKQNPVIICCGGGTDSTALIAYYLESGFDVRGVHFDYGQPALRGERQAIKAIAKYYRVPIVLTELRPTLTIRDSAEWLGRNSLFVLFACRFLESNNGVVSLGIHAGTPYYDCRPIFVDEMQHLLDGYFGGAVVLDAPFLHFFKQDVYAFCEEHNVPINLTYSCERNPKIPCGECLSCLDRSHYDIGT